MPTTLALRRAPRSPLTEHAQALPSLEPSGRASSVGRPHAHASSAELGSLRAPPFAFGSTLEGTSRASLASFAPTNRAEAVQLAQQLDAQLEAAGSAFGRRLGAMDAAFDEMIRQVGVQCAERGRTLAQMRDFYSSYAGAFGSITRKQQDAAGLGGLDEQLGKLTATQAKVRARVGAFDGRLRGLEKILEDSESPAAKLLLLAIGGQEDVLSRGEEDLAMLAMRRRLEALATADPRAQLLAALLRELSADEREAALCTLLLNMPSHEHVATLRRTLANLPPGTHARSLGALCGALSASEQLELIATLARAMRSVELVSLLQLALARLPKEKTLDTMEILLQLAPAVAASAHRIVERMSNSQRHDFIRRLNASLRPAELAQVKSELQLESVHRMRRVEAELEAARQELADLRAWGEAESARVRAAAVSAASDPRGAARILAQLSQAAVPIPAAVGADEVVDAHAPLFVATGQPAEFSTSDHLLPPGGGQAGRRSSTESDPSADARRRSARMSTASSEWSAE
jgi:hypothetical protein